ncbi:Histone deacetylase complex subunit [Exophiala oligosperma]
MSPRRSSRARSSQLPSTASNNNNNNSSFTTSNNSKPDRDVRTNNRTNSPRRPSINRSESGDLGEMSRAEQLPPRRSRRNGEDRDPTVKQQIEDGEEDVDPEAAEEEVTRCICGQAEYPGPSASLRQQQTDPDTLTDDTGNFFVQCDKCGVWQHGGCMGLLDESMLPDEYYCEQCKPEFHKITRSSSGPKSSHYLPVLEAVSTRSSPLTSASEISRKKDGKNRQNESTKRRATMNSRGAYDEDEMLRRAIEESKEMGTLGKRTREDIEDHKNNSKRQRTGSNASSTLSKHSNSPDLGADDTNGKGRNNKSRGAAARSNREKEMRDRQKEQQAAQRAEAASKRNARSERRRGDDSPPPTPSLSPSKAAQANGKKADTPPSGRSNYSRRNPKGATRRGRLGRNQYTRDHANGDDGTPARDGSHDINGNGGSPNGANGIHGESGRSSKAKTHPARTSLNEMRRRVAAILEFVGHMQTQTNTQSQPSSASSKGANTPNGVKDATALPTASLVRAVEAGLKEANSTDEESGLNITDQKEFGVMGSQDMMETLTKELVHWQSVYGVYSR